MSDYQAPNPFTPPRAAVQDLDVVDAGMVLADPGKRLAAYMLDALPGIVVAVVVIATMLPAFIPAFSGGDVEGAMRGAITSTRFLVVMGLCGIAGIAWGVYNIVLIYQHGQSWGKKLMGIRMVRTDGSRMSFARFFFLRCLVYGLVAAIPFIGWPIRLVDKLLIFRDSRQCLHDTIADTTVATAESSPRATLAGSRIELPTIRA